MRALLVAALITSGAAPAETSLPAAPAVTAEPARLAIATRIVAQLMPPGIYRKMMGGMFETIQGSMTNQMLNMPIRQFMRDAGLADADTQKIGPGTLREVIEVLDPAFDRRTAISMKIVSEGLIDVLSQQEPTIRAVMADAYARHFNVAQLTDIEAFFKTPSGTAYAEQSLLLASDPAVSGQMREMMPKVLTAMPALVKKISEATASLPKAKTAKDLTPAEKVRLEQLLGGSTKKAAS